MKHAKAASAGSTQATGTGRGLLRRALVTRDARRGSEGSGAPSSRRAPVALIAVLATITAFALTAAPAFAAPSAGTPAVSEVSYTTAHVSAEADPDGFASYNFEVSTDDENWTPNAGGFFFAKGTINASLTGLDDDTHYFVRLKVAKTFPAVVEVLSPGPNPSFTTLTADPPTIPGAVAASDIFSTSATGTAEVNRPAASDNVNCHFEYISDADFTSNPPGEGFAGATVRNCAENPIEAAGNKAVSAPLGCTSPLTEPGNCLSPATTYHLRLAAENAAGTVTKDASNFATLPTVTDKPTVIATDNASELAKRSAKATGKVERPAGADPALDVSCRFEFLTDAQFTANPPGEEFAGAGQAPCAQNPITSPAPDHLAVTVDVSAELPGLEPDTTYYLRLVAENGAGTDTKEAVATFTTLAVIHPTLALDSITEVGYTSFRVTGTADPGNQGVYPVFEFTLAGTEEWGGNPVGRFSPIDAGSPAKQISFTFPCGLFEYEGQFYGPLCDSAPLKPGTTYKVRMTGFDTEEYSSHYSPEPYSEFTTLGTNDPPTAVLDPVTDPTATTAHFSGSVDTHAPAGPLPDEAKAVYETKWHIECTPECKDANGNEIGGTVEAEEGSEVISGDTIRLDPNTHYEVKVIATNDIGTTESTLQTFDTPLIKPTVKASPGGSDGKGGYVLQGTVNPNNSPVSECFFAWGPKDGAEPGDYAFKAACSPMPKGRDEVQNLSFPNAQFKLSYRGQTTNFISIGDTSAADVKSELQALSSIGPDGISSVSHTYNGSSNIAFYEVHFGGSLTEKNVGPLRFELNNGQIGDASTPTQGGNNFPVTVEAPLTGLTPDANYNFRLFATNEAGTEKTANQLFTPTLAKADPCANEQLRAENSSFALPECRAYEMVSPPGKEGFGAVLRTYDGGDRVAYKSEATNIAKSGQGEAIQNFYVAERTAAGWETIPNLNGSSGSIRDAPSNFTALLLRAFSSDLLSTLWEGHRAGEPSVDGHNAPAQLRSPDGTFALIGNVGTSGIQIGGAPLAASADLSHLLTWTYSDIFPGKWGPGVWEYLGTGMDQPRRVDLDNSGAPISTCTLALGDAVNRSVSSDGSRIVNNVYGGCGGANPPAGELWARINGTTSVDVSASHCNRTAADPGGACNGPTETGGCTEFLNESNGRVEGIGCRTPQFAAATPDGSRVFFTTTQQLVNADTDQTNDIYACDLPSGNPAPSADKANPCAAFRQVSGAQTGAAVESVNATSENGATVLFTAKGALVDNKDALGGKAVPGDHNLYVWRADASHPDGETAFVGRLDSLDIPDINSSLKDAQATPDGRYLVFTTATQLVDTDTDRARDVYRYDADTGALTRASTNVFGVAGNNDDFPAAPAAPTEHHPTTTVSDDGTKIVFTTTEALSAVDGNAEPDVYLWTPARVYLISTGSSGSAPRIFNGFGANVVKSSVAIDPSGANIYFESPQQLTPADGDGATDVYDARIGGGFSFAPKPICTGEKCQPDPTLAPPKNTPLSAQPGPGNPPPPKPCPKGKIRNKKGKCAKKPKKHSDKKHHGKKHHGKKASHKQGGGK